MISIPSITKLKNIVTKTTLKPNSRITGIWLHFLLSTISLTFLPLLIYKSICRQAKKGNRAKISEIIDLNIFPLTDIHLARRLCSFTISQYHFSYYFCTVSAKNTNDLHNCSHFPNISKRHKLEISLQITKEKLFNAT